MAKTEGFNPLVLEFKHEILYSSKTDAIRVRIFALDGRPFNIKTFRRGTRGFAIYREIMKEDGIWPPEKA